MVQLFITIGLMTGYFMCYATVRYATTFSWRFPFALQAFISFFLAIASILYLPESPRWLDHRGRSAEAALAWATLGVATIDQGADISEELHSIGAPSPDLAVNRMESLRRRYHQAILNLRRVIGPASRKQALLGVFLMSMQQLSGIDGVIYVCA
jgi:MFS family permease